MRVYYTPDFSRKVETMDVREQNLTKRVAGYLQNHSKSDLWSHSTIKMTPTNQKNLHIIKVADVRYDVSFHSDDRGEYAIFVDISK